MIIGSKGADNICIPEKLKDQYGVLYIIDINVVQFN